MKKPLFVSIAVHKAQGLQTLPGVLESSEQICAWASKDYEVIQINDAEKPVTIKRIREALTPEDDDGIIDPAKLLDRPRIIVYFAGHGFAAWPDQYWILSRGPDQPKERISANLFREILASYGPAQIAFISDACRSPKALTGLGDAVLYFHPSTPVNPQKDIFYSCQPGESSFAVPAADGKPAYLVFSSVLLKGLSEPDGANLDKVLLLLNKQAVTSQSLSTYLEESVPEAALEVERVQITQCDPGFRPLDHIYVDFSPIEAKATDSEGGAGLWNDLPDAVRPTFEAGGQDGEPNIEAMVSYIKTQYRKQQEQQNAARQPERFNRSRSEWRAPLVRQIGEELRKERLGPSIAISGAADVHVVLADIGGGNLESANTSALAGGTTQIFSYQRPLHGFGETLCLRYGANSLSLVPMFDLMHTIGVVDGDVIGQGLEFLSWYPVYGDRSHGNELHSAEAVKGLSRGFLRSSDAQTIANQLRYSKHLDPMLGIVAAYLYSAAGDLANIRRMAYYYCQRAQPIPFDIVLLGNLPILEGKGRYETVVPAVEGSEKAKPQEPIFTYEATHEVHGEIAGLAPVLRVGWPYLRGSALPFHQVCWRFIDDLAPSPITTFIGNGAADAITAAFREELR